MEKLNDCHYTELQPVPADVCSGIDVVALEEALSYNFMNGSSMKSEVKQKEDGNDLFVTIPENGHELEGIKTQFDVSLHEQFIPSNEVFVLNFPTEMQPIIILGTVIGTLISNPLSVSFAESSNNNLLNDEITPHDADDTNANLLFKKRKFKVPSELVKSQAVEQMFQQFGKMIFPQKLWNLASNANFEAIHWSRDGTVIEINVKLFKPYLSRLTRNSKFSSFLRLLHLYKFRKTQNFNSKKIMDRTVVKYRRKGFSRDGWYSNISQ